MKALDTTAKAILALAAFATFNYLFLYFLLGGTEPDPSKWFEPKFGGKPAVAYLFWLPLAEAIVFAIVFVKPPSSRQKTKTK